MKKKTTLALATPESSIEAIRTLAANIQSRHRKNCHEAVIAGMHLAWLKDHYGLPNGGDRRSLAASGSSFVSLLADMEVPRKSAYRWMGKAKELAIALGILSADPDAQDPFPTPGCEDWDTIAAAAEQWSLTTSMDRLQVGGTVDDPDEQRLEHLMTAAEAGDAEALRWIDQWRAGKITLARAVCAYGGAEATKGKERKDPVYLAYDLIKKIPMGLIPKAFTTLHNGFQNWETYDEDARAGLTKHWRAVIKAAPPELTKIIRDEISK